MKKIENFWDFVRLLSHILGVRLGISRPLDLVPFLSHPDQEIRWTAADALSLLGDESVVEPTFEALQAGPDPHVRKRLVWVLERAKAWDKLFSCLDSPIEHVRRHAASSLSGSGQSQFVVPLLERMRECGGQDHTYWLALREIVDKSSVEPILELLSRASSPTMRGELLHLLGYTRDPRVFDLLVAALDDNDEEIRAHAVSGLVSLEDARAIAPLQKLLTDHSKHIRTSTQVALEWLEKLETEG